jgi:hypothetical protein
VLLLNLIDDRSSGMDVPGWGAVLITCVWFSVSKLFPSLIACNLYVVTFETSKLANDEKSTRFRVAIMRR